MQLGTAASVPGELVAGHLDVTDLPTGIPERLPVLIAEGTGDGPTLFLTAAIHGNEATGLATVESDHDGYVLARESGVAVYENDSLLGMAVRDDGDLVVAREEKRRP